MNGRRPFRAVVAAAAVLLLAGCQLSGAGPTTRNSAGR